MTIHREVDTVIALTSNCFMAFQGVGRETIQDVLWKKLVVSPIQQILSCIPKIIGLALAITIVAVPIIPIFIIEAYVLHLSLVKLTTLTVLFFSVIPHAIFWRYYYVQSQKNITILPNSLNHKTFNIFINQGPLINKDVSIATCGL